MGHVFAASWLTAPRPEQMDSQKPAQRCQKGTENPGDTTINIPHAATGGEAVQESFGQSRCCWRSIRGDEAVFSSAASKPCQHCSKNQIVLFAHPAPRVGRAAGCGGWIWGTWAMLLSRQLHRDTMG